MPFKTALLLRSKTRKPIKLPETSIFIFQDCFAIDQRLEFIYSYNDGISVHTTNPLNQIRKIDYKYEIRDIAAAKDHIYLLNDTSLVLYSRTGFNVLSKDFRDCRVTAAGDGLIGVQSRTEFTIFTHSFECRDVFRAQCSFTGQGILVLGDMNIVKVYIKGKKGFEVAMPGYISSVATDVLFTKIYCGTQDGKIYVVGLNGEELGVLEYHRREVTLMKMSFTGEHLYSSDGERMCVWSTERGVAVGFVDLEEGIEDFGVFLVDEINCDMKRIII